MLNILSKRPQAHVRIFPGCSMTRFTVVNILYFQQALYTQLSVAAEAGFVTLTDFDFLTQAPA